MRRRLEPRLLAAILAGLALALGLAASVLALGMQRQAVDAALPRLAFVAAEVGGTIEGGLGLGRPHALYRARRPAVPDSRGGTHPAMGGHGHQAEARQAPDPDPPDPRRTWIGQAPDPET